MCPTDVRSNLLHDFLLEKNYGFVPVKGLQYTFKPPRKMLDYVLAGNWQCDLIEKNIVIENDCSNVSDHLPIMTITNVNLRLYDQTPQPYIA